VKHVVKPVVYACMLQSQDILRLLDDAQQIGVALRVVEQPRFKAGYDFLLLRAESGEVEQELAEWWTRFLEADTEARVAMLTPEKKPARRRRRRRKGGGEGNEAEAAE